MAGWLAGWLARWLCDNHVVAEYVTGISEEVREREGKVANFEWNAWSYVRRRRENVL